MGSARETLGRLALFLLCVVLISISLGVLLSQLHLEVHAARNVVLITSMGGALASYMAAYKPGWLHKWLTESTKGEE